MASHMQKQLTTDLASTNPEKLLDMDAGSGGASGGDCITSRLHLLRYEISFFSNYLLLLSNLTDDDSNNDGSDVDNDDDDSRSSQKSITGGTKHDTASHVGRTLMKLYHLQTFIMERLVHCLESVLVNAR